MQSGRAGKDKQAREAYKEMESDTDKEDGQASKRGRDAIERERRRER